MEAVSNNRPLLSRAGNDRADRTARKEQRSVPESFDIQKMFREKYPWARVSVGSFEDAFQIKDYARAHYGSFEIVVSPEALERMKEDSAFRRQCERALAEAKRAQDKSIRTMASQNKLLFGRGLVLNEDGTVSQWVASGAAPSAASGAASVSAARNFLTSSRNGSGSLKRFQTKEGSVTIRGNKPKYNAAKDLLKVARAVSPQAVKSAIAGVQAQIYLLKTNTTDKKTANRLAAQAEQVVRKAKLKIRQLNKEQLVQTRQQRLKAAGEIRKAIQLRRALQQQRSIRKSREYGDVRNAYQMAIEEQERRQEEALLREAENSQGTDINAAAESPETLDPALNFAVPDAGGAGAVIDITV